MEEVIGRIKEYANKAKDGAFKLTRTVTDKTNNVVSQTKLKFAISETEGKIKEIYTQIGGELYEKYAEGANDYPELQEKMEKLDSLHKEVTNLKEQLAELKETVKCQSCGAYNHEDDVYCSKCGEKLEKESSEDEVVTIDIDPVSGEDAE